MAIDFSSSETTTDWEKAAAIRRNPDRQDLSFSIRTPIHVKSPCNAKLICRSIVGAVVVFCPLNVSIFNCTFVRGDSNPICSPERQSFAGKRLDRPVL
jgi:hypothetical protein